MGMGKTLKKILLFFVLSTSFAVFVNAQAVPRSSEDCLKCHEKQVPSHDYFQSSHKDLSCTACHSVDSHKKAPEGSKSCVVEFKPMDCAKCHAQAEKDHKSSVHNGKRLPVSCAQCHSDIHKIQTHKSDKLAIAQKCSECHQRQKDYFDSAHHQGLKKGHTDAATCTDCHGLHAITPIDNESKGRAFHTFACLKCHDDHEMMAKNKVTNIAGETYFNSFHGKNVRLGYPEKVAGCADCHSAHLNLKSTDPKSSTHKNNLMQTCVQCHSGASASFTQYYPHGDDHDSKNYPALYWTRLVMTGLLIGTFGFFWLHSLLWAIRVLIEKHQKAKEIARQALLDPTGGIHKVEKIKNGNKIYKRFETKHIILHIMVVVSFLALSLTGLPLKFNNTEWGKNIMNFIGGAERARWIHHAAALITFAYFFVAIAMSAKFLFYDKKQRGSFFEKLFSPDSLFPNMRDLRDIKAMFKWFLFLGPKPTFERWTYWEKFDFMAVFWGMFAIGLSGLLLWFPELFGSFLPGWMFNVATIIHSDEALLATGFIFTVHFFNTHFRPDKFPMDTVIFNGQITKEEMLEERGDQWRRYEAEGRLEEFAAKKPSSVVVDFLLKVFGFAAVAIGLSLVVGMIYALFFHA